MDRRWGDLGSTFYYVVFGNGILNSIPVFYVAFMQSKPNPNTHTLKVISTAFDVNVGNNWFSISSRIHLFITCAMFTA